jgi:hypothetical protein
MRSQVWKATRRNDCLPEGEGTMNEIKTKEGDFTLVRQMWCDGDTWLEKKGERLDVDDLFEEITQLRERVKELENEALAFKAVFDPDPKFHPDTDPNYAQGYRDAMRLFEDIYSSNKAATSNKIKTLEECIKVNAFTNDKLNADIIYVDDIEADILELRKKL